jgi:peptidoglycan-associated lipoprotein
MKTRKWMSLIAVVVFVLAGLYGCPKKADVSSAPESQPQKVEPASAPKAEDAAKAEAERAAAKAARKAEEERAAKEAAAMKTSGLHAIYFDFDRSVIRDDAKPIMKANTEYLKAHPKAKVRIEGHCDERGTIEYNQALGQRRAASAKKYLSDMGISSKRITLISYGKEKPVCQESSEDCWQKNRRADLAPVTE